MTTLMVWPAATELEPYPWTTVPCPRCGETELASACGFRPVDFVCMSCGFLTQICGRCLNGGLVCENHPEHPWAGEVGGEECCGGAGMPCVACCDPIPMDGTHQVSEVFTPRHLRGAR